MLTTKCFRNWLLTMLAIPFAACSRDTGAEAVLAVADELSSELAGFAPAQTVTIAPMWINGDSLPAELASGLRGATGRAMWDMDAPRDGTSAVLAFHPPRLAESDIVMVRAELLTFNADSFYGRDWEFELDCRRACKIVDRTREPGWLN